jgi:pimeloyl-ACP methyl ester carboxylesterase
VKIVLALALIVLATAADAYSDTSRNATSRPVRFSAADGIELVGRLSGQGDVGVILAHGYSQYTAQDDWLRFVPALVSRGYTVLTFNFRGFCNGWRRNCSEGPSILAKNWRDALAAIAFMKGRGVKKIFLIGASMGGVAVLRVARMPGVEVAGVVSLSTPQWPSKYYDADVPEADDLTSARLRQIEEPKLFVAGTRDVQRPGDLLRRGVKRVRFAVDAQRMYDASEEPKELLLVDSLFHSSELVTTALPAEVVPQTRSAVFRFLRTHGGT